MFRKEANPEVEVPRKCRLGLKCTKGYDDRCKYHEWTNEHDEAYPAILATSIGILLIIGVVLLISYDFDTRVLPIQQTIEGYNCSQLAEYVADKKPQYGYAEHRYGWLCVNENIKQFQG